MIDLDRFGAARRALGVSLMLLGIVSPALAQKAPTLGYVFPPAVRIGESTSVELGGYDLTPDMELFVHDPQVRIEMLGPPGEHHLPPPPYWHGPRAAGPAAPLPRELPARIDVESGAPAGLVRWQVANANGASATAVFYRSTGTELLEQRSRDLPQVLPALPVAVSGRLSRLTEVDRYQLVAAADGPITVQLMARQLGADFFAQLRVENERGQTLVDVADTEGQDAVVTFAARAGQRYTISLNDVDFRGDRAYVYRLSFSAGPHVVATLPAHGQRGTTQEVEFVGWGVATGAAQLETLRNSITFPADPQLVSYTHSLATPFGAVEVTIPLSDIPEHAPLAGSSTADSPKRMAPPFAVTDRFLAGQADHHWAWNMDHGQHWSVQVGSRAIGAALDVAFQATGPQTARLEGDDLPGTTDAGAELLVAESGTWNCRVTDLTAQGGALDAVYRLEVRPQTADFALSVTAQGVHVPLGGTAELAVKIARLGGFAGPVELAVEGLPDGVTVEGDLLVAADQAERKLMLRSAADAEVVARPIWIRGTATVGDAPRVRRATAPAGGNLCPRSPEQQRTDRLLLAMTMSPPFDLELIDAERQREVPRGTTYLAPFIIRRQEGFTGPLWLEMAAHQQRYRQGMRGPVVHVAEGEDSASYPCFMPEWLATDLTCRIIVQGVAPVADPRGNVRYLVKQAPSRITMILEGALMKLAVPQTQQTAPLGGTLDVPVSVSRASSLSLPVTVLVDIPEELSGLLEADPLLLGSAENEGTLRLRFKNDPQLAGPWSLRITAMALAEGRWPIVSEAELPMMFEAPED